MLFRAASLALGALLADRASAAHLATCGSAYVPGSNIYEAGDVVSCLVAGVPKNYVCQAGMQSLFCKQEAFAPGGKYTTSAWTDKGDCDPVRREGPSGRCSCRARSCCLGRVLGCCGCGCGSRCDGREREWAGQRVGQERATLGPWVAAVKVVDAMAAALPVHGGRGCVHGGRGRGRGGVLVDEVMAAAASRGCVPVDGAVAEAVAEFLILTVVLAIAHNERGRPNSPLSPPSSSPARSPRSLAP